jgi:hypothetical protein
LQEAHKKDEWSSLAEGAPAGGTTHGKGARFEAHVRTTVESRRSVLRGLQDLLGHKSGKITTHYSQAELKNLLEAANKVCAPDGHKMATLVMLKEKNRPSSAKQVGGFSKKSVVGATGFEPATT